VYDLAFIALTYVVAIIVGLTIGAAGRWAFSKIRARLRSASVLSDENFWLIHEWTHRNRWYHENSALRHFAVIEHGRLMQAEPKLTLEENLNKVARAVREKYPHEFQTLH
jgi:hypothetical protein